MGRAAAEETISEGNRTTGRGQGSALDVDFGTE